MLFHVIGAAHQLEARLEAGLAKVGLSVAKLGVLKALAETDEPLPLSDLAERVRCVRSNITQLVDRLEGDRLVRRVDDPDDRRVRRATLTAAGRKAYTIGTRIVAGAEADVARALSPADAAALERMLGTLVT